MAPLANILVVSDLHFGEELLPGASGERRHAVDLLIDVCREHPSAGLLVGRPSPGSKAFRDHVERNTARLEAAGCLDALCVLDSNRRHS